MSKSKKKMSSKETYKETYHVIVSTPAISEYCGQASEPYFSSLKFIMHMFTNKKYSPKEVTEKALAILNKTFPELSQQLEKDDLLYIMYETLPIDFKVGEEPYYVVVKMTNKSIQVSSNIPRELVNMIRDYRRKQITLVVCSSAIETDKMMFIEATRMFKGKTYTDVYENKFYFRGELGEPMEIDKILEIRERYGDNSNRLELDKKYIKAGLDYLTNYIHDEEITVNTCGEEVNDEDEDYDNNDGDDEKDTVVALREIEPSEITIRVEYPTRKFIGTEVPEDFLEPELETLRKEKGLRTIYIHRPSYRPEEQCIVIEGNITERELEEIREKIKRKIMDNLDKIIEDIKMERLKSIIIDAVRRAIQR